MKKILIISFLSIFFLLPFSPLKASGGDFSFRSTVLGDNVRNTNGFVYEIVNQKSNFSSSQNVYALTRIFNIRNVDSFQFKQVAYSSNNNIYETLYSPVYRPYGQWWSETYSWVNFGKLASGNYNLKTYISVDGGYYRELSQKNFTVGSSYTNYNDRCAYNDYNCNNNYNNNNFNNNYSNNHNYNNYNYNHRSSPGYRYEYIKTGFGVSGTGNNTKTIRNERSEFRTSENIYTLVKLNTIRDINTFRIKQDVYNSSNRLVKNSESGIYRPNNAYWAQSYIENNIGRLSEGDYRIKTYIKVNNDSYKYLGEKKIEVNNYNYDYNNNHNYNPSYDYTWTQSDNNIRHNSGYIYSLDNPKTTFITNENVVVLTKLSNIRNVDTLQIKHEFFKDGRTRYKTLESPERRPGRVNWEYNYNDNNFGTMPEGNHKIKVFIKINGGSWKQIDTVSITVKRYGSTSNTYYNNNNTNYNYDWTQTGEQVSVTTNPSVYYAYNRY
ncbi:MAG: hypothetical protein PF572_00310 [Patescibacteria group bacterium]|jgi:hypothetical protein|nr:hypothetical protein [Patescibacteria group bacterium]